MKRGENVRALKGETIFARSELFNIADIVLLFVCTSR